MHWCEQVVVVAAAMIIITPAHARADGPNMYIHDILHRPTYHKAYDILVRGQQGLPAWMSSAKAAMSAAGSPGETEVVEGTSRELFTLNEPHNAGRYFAVMFVSVVGGPAKGALSDGNYLGGAPSKRPIRYFGSPDDQDKLALKAALDRQ